MADAVSVLLEHNQFVNAQSHAEDVRGQKKAANHKKHVRSLGGRGLKGRVLLVGHPVVHVAAPHDHPVDVDVEDHEGDKRNQALREEMTGEKFFINK